MASGRSAGRASSLAACGARGNCSRTVVPSPGVESICTRPPDCRTNPYTIDSPSPLPSPVCLVVKNGSKTWAFTSSVMPHPLSITSRVTMSCRRPSPRVTRWFQVRILMAPLRPSMASRAFITRLMMAFSSWLTSIHAGQAGCCASSSNVREAGNEWRISSARFSSSALS